MILKKNKATIKRSEPGLKFEITCFYVRLRQHGLWWTRVVCVFLLRIISQYKEYLPLFKSHVGRFSSTCEKLHYYFIITPFGQQYYFIGLKGPRWD